MTHPISPGARGLAALALLAAGALLAGTGHAHGDAPAAPAAAADAAPARFAAVSERFELVGVLAGRQLTLYLDRRDDNSPVSAARIELEVAGRRQEAEAHGDEYEALLDALPPAGVLPIVARVTAGTEVQVLAGELELHPQAPASQAEPGLPWKKFAAWGAGGLAALAAFAWLASALRRRAPARQRAKGGAA